MGQKVNPKIFRVGITQDWKSKWFSRKSYGQFLEQDIKIRKFIKNKLKDGGLADIEIERSSNNIKVNIFTSKPGVVIGRGGSGAEVLRKQIKKEIINDNKVGLNLNISEVTNPSLCAQVVLNSMIEQTEKRIPFRRVLKQAIESVMRAGAKGVKVQIAGRLNGAEIARTEKLAAGRLPLHTIRADIDYSRGAAHTTYGAVGIKVWIYKGEVFNKDLKEKSAGVSRQEKK
ncbi:MAG: 30S ribosomal protein S3 [Patescibacteria group bacterium]